jgi:hypothetical protein
MLLNQTGANNTVVGVNALCANTLGACNVAIGVNAGLALTTGNGNTIIGTGITGSAGMADTILIGAGGVTQLTVNPAGQLFTTSDIAPAGGIFVGTPLTTNRYIANASTGGGSLALYIGNAAIQTVSDIRLKENVVDTEVNASEELKKVRVVDFNWNDPSDTSYNNRNARGKWTGMIAQELIDVFPFAVNAPRKEEDLSIDTESELHWNIEPQQLVAVLIKAFQEQQDRIEALEAEVATLKGA